MLASATYLKIKSMFMLPRFAFHVSKVSRQAKKSEGLIHFSVKSKGLLKYYTLTVWKNKENMSNFRDKGDHLKAMKIINKLSNEYSFISWETDSIPGWEEVFKRVNNENQNK